MATAIKAVIATVQYQKQTLTGPFLQQIDPNVLTPTNRRKDFIHHESAT